MKITGIVKLDTSGRINISRLFETVPEKVLVVFDTDELKVIFFDATTIGSGWQADDIRKVDEKCRVCLPKWLREELGDEYLITTDCSKEHYLLPRCFFNF